MKELSIEEKAKRYDEAIERAKERYENMPLYDLEYIFPELKESEGEKIRKAIINVFASHKDYEVFFGASVEDILSWLEKQAEQKYTDNLTPQEAMDIAVSKCFEQSEQKPAKVEPKFKIGEWVILTAGELSSTLKIVGIDSKKKKYYFDDYSFLPIVDEDLLSLWTIQDAKDGDVLCCESGWTCIFKTLNNDNMSFSSYCFMDNTGWFCETGSEGHTLDKAFIKAYNGNIYPATKEQRDLLFQKMKEAGYEWDAEKKELKKIEQSPLDVRTTGYWHVENAEQNTVWSEEGEKKLSDIIKDLVHPWNEYIPDRIEDEIKWLKNRLKSLKDKVPPQHKQEWSQEDEAVLDALTRRLEGEDIHVSPHLAVKCLKSLKARYTWKPSDEQMQALKIALNDDIMQYDFKGSPIKEEVTRKHAETIESLYNDLKKLKQ